jgi:DNA-binding FadR family transcriptional regulator
MAFLGVTRASDLDSGLLPPKSHLANHIEAFLARRIISGELPPGSALPSQDDLVRQFGVSRAVVRQAITTLAHLGLLDVRHGRATYVTESDSWNVLDPFVVGVFAEAGNLMKVWEDFFSVRLIVEPEAAAMVAAGHDGDHLSLIREALERMEQVRETPSRESVNRGDRDFHWRLASATGNQVLMSIMRSVEALLWAQLGLAVSLYDPQGPTLTEHRAIYEALVARDADAARAAMRTHLTNGRHRLLQVIQP